MGSAALLGFPALLEPRRARWEIGCFNRPWASLTFDEALDGVRAAGFRVTGLLTGQKGEPFTGPDATPLYLTELHQRIASRDLTANMTSLGYDPRRPEAESISRLQTQIDNAARLGLRYAMTFGVEGPEHYEPFYRAMRATAAYAARRHVQVVVKPHGGIGSTGAGLAETVEKVGHPNFRVWYDAGNIIYYANGDPVAELEPVMKYVTGFCAKDCGGQGKDVMIQFGTGKVDFAAVFRRLHAARFHGPVMIECCKLGTPAEITANARANREYLERVLASIR